MSKVLISNRGGGFVTATQDADSKQLSQEQIEKLVSDHADKKYVLQSVNNATSTMKVNPRAREVNPDSRVYTLLLASKIKAPRS